MADTGPPKDPKTMGMPFGKPTPPAPPTTYALGIDYSTGRYFRPHRPTGAFAWQVSQRPVAAGGGKDPRATVDPNDLSEAGWGVIWADEATRQQVEPKLRPLLELRKEQAGDLFLERIHRRGQRAHSFLLGEGDVPGPAEEVPYYLLLVGDPEILPFDFQQMLDLRYAVGRLYFDELESYGRYAQSVIAAENGATCLERRATFFGVEHPTDPVTKVCNKQLIQPLLGESSGRSSWSNLAVLRQEATRAELIHRLSSEPPAVLVTAGHSPVFSRDEPQQEALQGSIVTADWSEADPSKGLQARHLFAASDVGAEWDLSGMISMLVGCFTAGTPKYDSFARGEPSQLASRSFIARLPQALLNRGALAAVAHFDTLYLHSFDWPGSKPGPQHQTYGDMLHRLMNGHRLGHAMDSFGRRYGDLAAHLLSIRLNPVGVGEETYAAFWIGYHDARQFVVIGDPAVRLPLKPI